MILSIRSTLALGAVFVPFAATQVDPRLTGTWTTKSRKVVTGPVGIPFLDNYRDFFAERQEIVLKW